MESVVFVNSVAGRDSRVWSAFSSSIKFLHSSMKVEGLRRPPLELLPISCVQVLHHVNAVFRNLRVKRLETRDDVTHHVAAIVEDDVGCPKLVQDTLQELLVLLPANAHFDLIFLVSLAFRQDVDSNNPGVGTKVSLPHLKGSAK